MKIRFVPKWASSALWLSLLANFATASVDHNPEVTARIEEKLGSLMPIESITHVPETDFYRLRLQDGTVLFTSSQVEGFFVGDVFSFNGSNFINQSETMLNAERYEQILQVPQEELIIFPAIGKKIGEAYVFTDIDCGYCRKLHAEIKQYQQAGIEIRYLAWPRCGVGPGCESYTKAVNVWCSDNRQSAITDAKAGKTMPAKECANPVARHFALGQQLGLRGTPFIMLSNGIAVPGYISAADLAQRF